MVGTRERAPRRAAAAVAPRCCRRGRLGAARHPLGPGRARYRASGALAVPAVRPVRAGRRITRVPGGPGPSLGRDRADPEHGAGRVAAVPLPRTVGGGTAVHEDAGRVPGPLRRRSHRLPAGVPRPSDSGGAARGHRTRHPAAARRTAVDLSAASGVRHRLAAGRRMSHRGGVLRRGDADRRATGHRGAAAELRCCRALSHSGDRTAVGAALPPTADGAPPTAHTPQPSVSRAPDRHRHQSPTTDHRPPEGIHLERPIARRRHRSRGLHRFPPHRGARSRRATGEGHGAVQLLLLVRLARDPLPRCPGPGRDRPRRRPGPGFGPPSRRRGRQRLPLGRAHRHPLLLPGAPQLRGHQRHRHPERPGGGTGRGHTAAGAHLHQRDLRHRADRTDHRGPPHQHPVPLMRLRRRAGTGWPTATTRASALRW